MIDKAYTVRAVHCDHRAGDEEVYLALKRATTPLHRAWERLRCARTIAIKFNQDYPPHQLVLFEHHRQQLVSDCVARAVLRLLRENTAAHLICVDASYYVQYENQELDKTTHLAPLLRESGVDYVNCDAEPIVWHATPDGGLMFDHYPLAQALVEADAVVSVQKMKNHAFMGVTLCLKNLFGLMPMEPIGRPRAYYHHFIRMPYMLADLGRMLDPALNVIDALIGQAGMEWGNGKGLLRIVDGLIAGDHVIATDACAAHLMGHDPTADYPQPPFHRDRNALLVAAEHGFGTVNLNEIDFVSEISPQPEGTFFAVTTDPPEIVRSWRRTMCEQGIYYRDHQTRYHKYAGEYILIQDGEVRWHDKTGRILVSRRDLAGRHRDRALWLKYVDPDEREGEHYEVYENTLRSMLE